MTPELLAPAGQPDAGYAALHYGADAVYLGLNRFSARAEAVNFTPDELSEFTAYAHSLTPRRQVYLTLNTVVQQDELADAADTLLVAATCDVDAVIVQDLGVARLARQYFPHLPLHASTQMAVHNLEGALAAKSLGFSRVTLARELTLEEIRHIAREAGVEVETFVHGTLCYSYSGLCLFSSMVGGRSGNRGRCQYTCREAADTPYGRAHPFSLKDLSLGGRIHDLAAAGVASLKIEGRKKSPLYVAATVDYYRRLLDGRLTPDEEEKAEARLKTIFARPWTRLFLDGRQNPAAADPLVVGHRGSPIGRVERLLPTPAGPGIAFTPGLPVERHDGLQTDLPGEPRPYGFPVDNLYAIKGKRLVSVFAADAGNPVAVVLPPDAPDLAPGLPLYLASSQMVKRSYPFPRPRPGLFKARLAVSARLTVTGRKALPDQADIECLIQAEPPTGLLAILPQEPSPAASVHITERESCFPAREAAGAEKAAKDAFERLGDSPFLLRDWQFDNPDSLYVRPSVWNRVRRETMERLEAGVAGLTQQARRELFERVAAPALACARGATADDAPGFVWSLAVSHPDQLAAFPAEELAAFDNVAITIPGRRDDDWLRSFETFRGRADAGKIRLTPPLLFRDADGSPAAWIGELHKAGWTRWLVPGLSWWRILSRMGSIEMTADWPLYTLNRYAASQLLDMGFRGITLSPEDDAANMRRMASEYADVVEVVAYSALPLFLSAACAHSHLRRCPGKDGVCRDSGHALPIRLERSGKAEIWTTSCGSVVTGPAFSLANDQATLADMGIRRLRIDLRWRNHTAEDIRTICNNVKQKKINETIPGNFHRGLS